MAMEEERVRREAAEQERLKEEADALALAMKAQKEAEELAAQQAIAMEEERIRKETADEFAAQGAKMEEVIAKLRREAEAQDKKRMEAAELARLRKEAAEIERRYKEADALALAMKVQNEADVVVAEKTMIEEATVSITAGDVSPPVVADMGGAVGGCMLPPTMSSPTAMDVQENVNFYIASVSDASSTDIIIGLDNLMHSEVHDTATTVATFTNNKTIEVTEDIHHTSNDIPTPSIPSSSSSVADIGDSSVVSTNNAMLTTTPLGLEVFDEAVIMPETQDMATYDTPIDAVADVNTAATTSISNNNVIASVVEVDTIGEVTDNAAVTEHVTSQLPVEDSLKGGSDDVLIETNEVEEQKEEKVDNEAEKVNEEQKEEEEEPYEVVDHLADGYIEDDDRNDAAIHAMLTFQQGNDTPYQHTFTDTHFQHSYQHTLVIAPCKVPSQHTLFVNL